MDLNLNAHRPRNVDWKRAAALLYGDWGTSKAYVTGLAFAAAGFASLPLILAVCALTGLVGINYAVICAYFPDGGGVYSAARSQSRSLAVIGALLLVADLTVTASLSGFSALSYFPIDILPDWMHAHAISDHIILATVVMLLVMGFINYFGPKHSGTLAVVLTVPTVIVVLLLIAVSAPHLTTRYLENHHQSFPTMWVKFVEVILALSGVEAIANLTGVMRLDQGCTPENPKVGREAGKAIWPVAIEVVFGTALLGWAMLSIPKANIAALTSHQANMLAYIGDYFGTLTLGAPIFGQIIAGLTGAVFFLLLLSAANTAIVAMIGLLFMMARDDEMPRQFSRLNNHGVPKWPLGIAVALPIIVLAFSSNLDSLAGLYAIGVVGAITVNLGSCTWNRALPVTWYDRLLFGFTFVILFAVEITLAKTKPDALFFVSCILIVGMGLRAFTQKRAGLTTVTVARELAAMVTPEAVASLRKALVEGQKIMVAARGITPVLRYALEEAELRKAMLCVLYVKELSVFLPAGAGSVGRAKWQEDPQAQAIMNVMLKMGEERNVQVIPIYTVSEDPAVTILDLTATLGIDYLMLGASHRLSMAKLLKGNVVEKVAAGLPEDIQLIIHG